MKQRQHTKLAPVPGSTVEPSIAVDSTAQQTSRPLTQRRFFALAITALAVVALISTFGAVFAAQQQQQPTHEVPLKPLYIWLAQATYASKTPQEAFDAGMKLTPCQGEAPATAVITWLETSPSYGLALIDATCSSRERPYALWLFSLKKDAEQHWTPAAGATVRMPDKGSIVSSPQQQEGITPTSVVGLVPMWLQLPPDTYDTVTLPGPGKLPPDANVVAWFSSTRIFVFGQVSQQTNRPSDAFSTTINGHDSWAMVQHGIVTVTLPLADNTTIFFAGTGTVALIENLASSSASHSEEILSPFIH